MKKLLLLFIISALSCKISAQSDVTKFLGIPVDGTKPAMIEKLKAKGFRWNAQMECLEGEFNGEEVYVRVLTNNNKVWRIALMDKLVRDEGQIRVRFNNLVDQFEANRNYRKPIFLEEDQRIPDKERIGDQIWLHHKQYQASFIQTGPLEDVESMSEEEAMAYLQRVGAAMMNNSVWFSIHRDKYDEFRLLLYYDNERNHAQGDDL